MKRKTQNGRCPVAAGSPRPFTAWVAYNFGIPWGNTLRRTRRDCIAATKANLTDPEDDFRRFMQVAKVTVTPVVANTRGEPTAPPASSET